MMDQIAAKSLNQAIKKALQQQGFFLDKSAIEDISIEIKSFLADRFGAAVIKSQPPTVEIIDELWTRIIKKEDEK